LPSKIETTPQEKKAERKTPAPRDPTLVERVKKGGAKKQPFRWGEKKKNTKRKKNAPPLSKVEGQKNVPYGPRG